MEPGSSTPTSIPKVVLTKTVIEENRRVIFSQNRFANSPILEGKLLHYEAPDAFTLYAGTSQELVNTHVVSSIKPCVVLTIVLEGTLTFGYDDLEFQLDGSRCAEVLMVNLTHPVSFHRSIEKDNQLTKVNLVISPNWLKARLNRNERPYPFVQSHLNYLRQPINGDTLEVIKRILSCEQPSDLLGRLELESLSLQLIQQMFALVDLNTSTHKASKETPQSERIKRILHFIETHLEAPMSLDVLAARFSMSTSNLQRVFKDELGITVKSYIRQRRLHVAKTGLERGVLTVTEAAYEAGYNHPANFTNAFKKEFGVPPAKVVKHL
ncbi:AraC family transcriptional regulator [Vibrio caribbeanicus]|uniref:AraC family transcriptional regulator n=1 Tax=Vibrio caribbeanicus TaxID=701175 RepID=A0ACC4NYZ2_9VIBR|nr:AraC family transcriptional regulator [Vibrio caribbeanicus]KHD25745.1 AraC family transcriptional regulator [Vibrio caribbeanicus]